jgi:glycosyltransferase involved in cell wall biosynthesis
MDAPALSLDTSSDLSSPWAVVVVPCYNEEARLDREAFLEFLAARAEVLILFVNDGSRDGTAALIEGMVRQACGRAAFLNLRENRGKAEAVRAGLRFARRWKPRVVAFWDADLATPLEEIPAFMELMGSRPEVEVVMGSRVKLLGRQVERKLIRHYIGRVFATMASNYLRLPVYDTQCGAKMFRCTPTLDRVLARPFLARWLFDVELLVRFLRCWRREGIDGTKVESRVVEVPLQRWMDVKGSKVKASDFPKALGEFFRIMRCYGWKP